jgi:putative spermidine/putrescine transport system permease protein
VSSIALGLVVAVVVAYLLAPILVVAASSLTSKGYLQFPPQGLSLRWYTKIADDRDFIDAFLTSLELALATAIVALLTAVPAALAINRQPNAVTRSIEQLFLSPLVLPAVVFGVAFLVVLTSAGYAGTFQGALLAHVILTTPFVMRSVLTGLGHLDPRLAEASQSLGAGPLRTFLRVTLPSIRTSVLTGAIFAFIISFDEAVVTLFLVGPNFHTLPVAIFTYVQYSNDPTVAALSTVLVLLSGGLLLLLSRLTDVRDHA